MKDLFLFEVSEGKFALWNSLTLKIAYGNEQLKRIYYGSPPLSGNLEEEIQFREQLKHAGILLSKQQINRRIKLLKKMAQQDNRGTLYISPTLRCNLSCKYCIVRDLSDANFRKLDMEESKIRRILSVFLEMTKNIPRQREIVIFGGEPFLVPEKVKLIAEIIRKDDDSRHATSRIDVVTNGTLITDEIVGLLRKYNLFTIISVDGKPRTNFNGRGNYQIDEGIKKIIGAHLPFGLSVTIGKHNIDDLEQNVLYLIKKFHPTDIGLNNYLHPLRSKYSNNFEVVGRDCLNTLALIYEKIARKGIFIEPMTRRIGSIVEEIPRLKDCPACGNKIVALPEEVIGRCEYFCLHKMHLLDIETLSDSSPSSNHLWQSLSPINWK